MCCTPSVFALLLAFASPNQWQIDACISPVGTVEYMAPEVPLHAALHLSVHCSQPFWLRANARLTPATLPMPGDACQGFMP